MNAVGSLLDTLDPQPSISKLAWVLGQLIAPKLEERFLGYLAHCRDEAQNYHAGIHNMLIVLNHRTYKSRYASVYQIKENLRPVEEYLDMNYRKSGSEVIG